MASNEAPDIGPIIQRERKARHLTLERLAALSGVSRSMLSQIERGESNPTFAAFSCNLTARERAGCPRATSASNPSPRLPTGIASLDVFGCSAPRSAAFAALSSALIFAQKPGSAPAARSSSEPKTCGWRRIIFAVMASTTLPNAKAPSSSAMRAW